jgi:cell wall-associated NlpC family hydrolase
LTDHSAGARHRADVRPSTPFDPVLTSAHGIARKTAAVVASSGLVAVGSVPAFGVEAPAADPSVLSASARSVLGAQSLASVPAAADWTLDIPAPTVATAVETRASNNKSVKTARAAEAEDAAEPAPEPKAEPAPQKAEAAAEKPESNEKAESKPAARASLAKAEAKPAKSAKPKASKPKAKASKSDSDQAKSASAAGSDVLEVASRYIGVPYVYGGTSPKGFDCSGFTQYVYGQLGIKLPHQSEAQRSHGKVVSRANARPGDLIWTPGHVAIYAGGNKMIDSARRGTTVQYRNMWQSNPVFIRLG